MIINFSGNGISGSATQKIIELSRKNRDIHSELTKEKTRVRQLQKQLSKLISENTKQQEEVIQWSKNKDISFITTVSSSNDSIRVQNYSIKLELSA